MTPLLALTSAVKTFQKRLGDSPFGFCAGFKKVFNQQWLLASQRDTRWTDRTCTDPIQINISVTSVMEFCQDSPPVYLHLIFEKSSLKNQLRHRV